MDDLNVIRHRREALEHMALSEQEADRATQAMIRAGEALLQAREQVPADQWEQWQRDNLNFSLETAAEYMRLAEQHRGGES